MVWEEAAMFCFKVLSRHLLGEIAGKNSNDLSKVISVNEVLECEAKA